MAPLLQGLLEYDPSQKETVDVEVVDLATPELLEHVIHQGNEVALDGDEAALVGGAGEGRNQGSQLVQPPHDQSPLTPGPPPRDSRSRRPQATQAEHPKPERVSPAVEEGRLLPVQVRQGARMHRKGRRPIRLGRLDRGCLRGAGARQREAGCEKPPRQARNYFVRKIAPGHQPDRVGQRLEGG